MNFSTIYDRAAKRKGGEDVLQVLLSTIEILSASKISKIPDDRFLSMITRGVFQAGFNWKVI